MFSLFSINLLNKYYLSAYYGLDVLLWVLRIQLVKEISKLLLSQGLYFRGGSRQQPKELHSCPLLEGAKYQIETMV